MKREITGQNGKLRDETGKNGTKREKLGREPEKLVYQANRRIKLTSLTNLTNLDHGRDVPRNAPKVLVVLVVRAVSQELRIHRNHLLQGGLLVSFQHLDRLVKAPEEGDELHQEALGQTQVQEVVVKVDRRPAC